jgi:hypothetical protein
MVSVRDNGLCALCSQDAETLDYLFLLGVSMPERSGLQPCFAVDGNT